MNPAPARSLLAYLAQVPDPRGLQGRRHSLVAMLAAVVCAILSGARGYDAIAQWLHLQPVAVWHMLGFTRRPPKRSAFRNLLMRLCPDSFEKVLTRWMENGLEKALSEDSLQAVCFDGKTLRGTIQSHQRLIHLLAALDQQTGCVLHQLAVDQKTNEHKAALQLLQSLVLRGRVIVGDAMFCQTEICQKIRDGGGHYFVVVKDNQPQLRRDIAAAFADAKAFSPLRWA